MSPVQLRPTREPGRVAGASPRSGSNSRCSGPPEFHSTAAEPHRTGEANQPGQTILWTVLQDAVATRQARRGVDDATPSEESLLVVRS